MAELNVRNRTIFCRDNLDVLRGINDECIDLIYLDPPFTKKKPFRDPMTRDVKGGEFKDIFQEEDVKDKWLGQIADEYPHLADYLNGIGKIRHKSNKNYLCYMAIRLIEMRRVLKRTGSIYLHCDQTMGHYLKLVLDCIFGASNFRNEIIWAYGLGGSSKYRYSQKHDTLYFYSKTKDYHFVKPLIPATSQMLAGQMKGATDVFNIPSINNMAKERTGVPTQKPLELLERIIKASTQKGDVVLDPFCGTATTCVMAEALERRWVGIDISKQAHYWVNKRIRESVSANLSPGKVGLRTTSPRRTDNAEIKIKKKSRMDNNKQTLYGLQDGYCVGCKYWFPFKNLTIDHIKPDRNDNIKNLQLLCPHCNSIKGKRNNRYLRKRLRELGCINEQKNQYGKV